MYRQTRIRHEVDIRLDVTGQGRNGMTAASTSGIEIIVLEQSEQKKDADWPDGGASRRNATRRPFASLLQKPHVQQIAQRLLLSVVVDGVARVGAALHLKSIDELTEV